MSFEGMTDREIVDLVRDDEAYEVHVAKEYPAAYVAGIESGIFDLETYENPTYTCLDDYRDWADQHDALDFSNRFDFVGLEEIVEMHQAFTFGRSRIFSAIKENRRVVV